MSKLFALAVAEVETLPEEEQDRLAVQLLEDAKRAAIQEALKDVEEGRTVPHNKVKTWLESWGTENELPPPE